MFPVVEDLDGLQSLKQARAQWLETQDDIAAWNSWCYHLFDMKCGMYVIVSGGADGGLQLLAPLCNARYRNESPLFDGERGADARERCARAQQRFPRAKRHHLRPADTWAFNGPLVDNWCSAIPWGTGWCASVEELLNAAAKRLPDGSVHEFMFNPRDYPQLRVGLRRPQPLPPMGTRGWRRHSRPSACYRGGGRLYHVLPVLSQYTLADSVDTPVPPVRCFRDDPPVVPEWAERLPKVVFRGSATSPHGDDGNQRLRAARILRNSKYADVRLTGPSYRFRLTSRGRVEASDLAVTGVPSDLAGGYLTPSEQGKYRMGLYIEGNSGADRLPMMLASRMLVIAVRSSAPAISWMRDGTLVAGEHYVECASVEDLPRVVEWWAERSRDAQAMAERGHACWRAHMQRGAVVDAFATAIAGPRPPPLLVGPFTSSHRESFGPTECPSA